MCSFERRVCAIGGSEPQKVHHMLTVEVKLFLESVENGMSTAF